MASPLFARDQNWLAGQEWGGLRRARWTAQENAGARMWKVMEQRQEDKEQKLMDGPLVNVYDITPLFPISYVVAANTPVGIFEVQIVIFLDLLLNNEKLGMW